MIDGTILAFLESTWRWPAPTKAGDTIMVKITPTEKELGKSGTKGSVTYDLKIVNQNDVVVCESMWKLLVIV